MGRRHPMFLKVRDDCGVNPMSQQEASTLVSGADRVLLRAHDFPPELKQHGALEEVVAPPPDAPGPALWVVRGVFPMRHGLALPVTMSVYRDRRGDVTLFNALRVSEAVEMKMFELGQLRNVVKIAQFHGVADAYYTLSGRFGEPALWTLPGGSVADGMDSRRITLMGEGSVPVAGAQVYSLEGLPYPECVVVLPGGEGGNLLVCGDSLMHVCSLKDVKLFSRMLVGGVGYTCKRGQPHPSPLWLRIVVPMCSKPRVERWFREILALNFKHVVSAHGPPLMNADKQIIEAVLAQKLARFK